MAEAAVLVVFLLAWATLAAWVVVTLAAIRQAVEELQAEAAATGQAVEVVRREVVVIQAAVAAMEAAVVGEMAAATGVAMGSPTNPAGRDEITTTDTVTTMVTTTPTTPAGARVITAETATMTAGGKDGTDD